jgi:hypothetical protein
MEAHSLSPQYLLVVEGSHSARIVGVWLEGDFAAGLRGSVSDGGSCGDFATGMRIARLRTVIADYAAGQRTRPPEWMVRGDFATGQRAARPDGATRDRQPVRQRRSWLPHRPAIGA